MGLHTAALRVYYPSKGLKGHAHLESFLELITVVTSQDAKKWPPL